jgi:hypothetical protein
MDIRPAAGLGMRTVLVAIEHDPPSETASDAVVLSLFEAQNVLTRWLMGSSLGHNGIA